MGRSKKYGEETVLFARKVPKSKERAIKLMVDSFLESAEKEAEKAKNEFKTVKKAFDKVLEPKTTFYGSAKGIAAIEKVIQDEVKRMNPELSDIQKDLVLTGSARSKTRIVPRQIVNLPPDEDIEAPSKVIQDSKTGFIAYPCGCIDNGKLLKNLSCSNGDQANHKIIFNIK